MKKRAFIRLFILFSISLSMLVGNTVYSKNTSSDEVIYPANEEQVFEETADEFYQALRELKYPVHQELVRNHQQKPKEQQIHLDTTIFKEIPDATVNFRIKGLFYEVQEFNHFVFDGNMLRSYPEIDNKNHQMISPNRQVYFFYSHKDTDKEFSGRYAIYDVETKEILTSGNTYFPKSPTQ